MGTPIENYRLLVVTGGVEPQEGSGIARACTADLKVYPGIEIPQYGVCTRRDGGNYGEGFIQILGLF